MLTGLSEACLVSLSEAPLLSNLTSSCAVGSSALSYAGELAHHSHRQYLFSKSFLNVPPTLMWSFISLFDLT